MIAIIHKCPACGRPHKLGWRVTTRGDAKAEGYTHEAYCPTTLKLIVYGDTPGAAAEDHNQQIPTETNV